MLTGQLVLLSRASRHTKRLLYAANSTCPQPRSGLCIFWCWRARRHLWWTAADQIFPFSAADVNHADSAAARDSVKYGWKHLLTLSVSKDISTTKPAYRSSISTHAKNADTGDCCFFHARHLGPRVTRSDEIIYLEISGRQKESNFFILFYRAIHTFIIRLTVTDLEDREMNNDMQLKSTARIKCGDVVVHDHWLVVIVVNLLVKRN